MASVDHTPLHVYVRDHGTVLATRPLGRRAADHVRAIADEPGDLILDFEGVEVATPPFLQELVDVVHGLVLRDTGTGRIVVFANMNEDLAETMRYVVAKRKLSVAYREGNSIELLEAKPHLTETLRTAQRLRSFTAPQLADKLNIENDTATQRLKKLLETGAVVREVDPEAKQGIRHLYRAATPELVGPGKKPAAARS
jgi:DNA-binding MarR family transcriptional regulator